MAGVIVCWQQRSAPWKRRICFCKFCLCFKCLIHHATSRKNLIWPIRPKSKKNILIWEEKNPFFSSVSQPCRKTAYIFFHKWTVYVYVYSTTELWQKYVIIFQAALSPQAGKYIKISMRLCYPAFLAIYISVSSLSLSGNLTFYSAIYVCVGTSNNLPDYTSWMGVYLESNLSSHPDRTLRNLRASKFIDRRFPKTLNFEALQLWKVRSGISLKAIGPDRQVFLLCLPLPPSDSKTPDPTFRKNEDPQLWTS